MSNMRSFEIGPMTQEHWEAVREIYQEGIATGNATFETSVPELERMGRASPAIMQAQWRAGKRNPWMGGAESRFQPVGLRRRRRSKYLCRRASAGTRDRSPVTRGSGESLRTKRHLDATGGNLSLKIMPVSSLHQQSGFRIVGTARTARPHGWTMARHVLMERRSAVAISTTAST